MQKPKISVVVPIYGVEKYLRQCVDSILNQTLKDIEVILVDDGSPDKCPQIVDEYAEKDKRVVAIHKPNGGYGSACNIGLNAAKGEYIAICEPDDWIDPTMYEELYNLGTYNNADVVKSEFYKYIDCKYYKKDQKQDWYKNSKLYQTPTGVFTLIQHPEFLYFHPSIWGCIYKSTFLKKHNIFVEEIPGAGWADNLFQVQTLTLAKRICFTERAFYHWRVKQPDDALDLKDLTIPCLRTETIHKWLHDNNITNQDIRACLTKREIAYLNIITHAGNAKRLRKVLSLINKMVNNINIDTIKDNKYIIKTEIKDVKHMRHFMLYYYKYLFNRKLSNLRRTLLCIHWPSIISPDEIESFICVLGIMFYKNCCSNIPTLLRIKIKKGVLHEK